MKFIDTTIQPVVPYAFESWGDPKDQYNLSKIEEFYFLLCTQILGVKSSTNSSKLLGELGRFPFRISIETQIFET